ncbi:MAG: extracellular solute-binding protein [Treponema sp.]|jgi:raffinose/stachyose/melibiose transport system substrate-binding protein|nr:extracellular solute-binding protein [Treponema sp.]
MTVFRHCLVFCIVAGFAGCDRKNPGFSEENPVDPLIVTVTYVVGDVLTTNLKHRAIQKFMRLHPQVIMVEKLGDDIRIMDAVDEFPDLMETRYAPDQVRAGKLGELPKDIVDLFEKTVPIYSRDYTAPIEETYPIGIVYSKKIFRQLGINPEDIKTYGDFLGICEKIKNAGIPPLVFGGADTWHFGFWWGYFWQREIAVQDPDWIARRYAHKTRFSDPEVRAVLTGFKELFERGYIGNDWIATGETQCPDNFVKSLAAMYYIGPFAFQQIAELDPSFEFGFFAIPDDQGRINIIGGPTDTGWAISMDAQNDPSRAEVIYDFIRYFFSREIYAEYLSQSNAISTLKEKYSYTVHEVFQQVLRVAMTADDKQLNWNQKPGANELPQGFRNFCYRLAGQIFLNEFTIDEGLRLLDEEWERRTKQFNPALESNMIPGEN